MRMEDEASVSNISFGQALYNLKRGAKVTRKGWNGKGMWLGLVKSSNYMIMQAPYGDGNADDPDECENLLPWIGMKTADKKFVPWAPSQADMLAEDWEIVK